jgi:hypothetical protein
MHQRLAILAFAGLFLFPFLPHSFAAARGDDPAVPAILAAAESLFQTMKARDYPATWSVLTEKSRDTIVSDTEEAIRKAGETLITKEQLREDFAAGGPTCRQYWEGFLRRFDPDDALERSRWEMGVVEKDRAEVLITHRGADRPAVLRMFREGGSWKAGLVETFWGH